MIDRTYLCFACCRSGQHAVYHWICSQFPGVINFRNCWSGGWEEGVWLPTMEDSTKVYQNDGRLQANMFTSENKSIVNYPRYNMRKFIQYDGTEQRQIIVIRDWHNWVASYVASRNGFREFIDDSLADLWIEQAKEALGLSKYLDNAVHVKFPMWFSNTEYRSDLAALLGIPTGSKGLDDVSNHGGGSTFDGTSFNGSGSQMNVLRRFESMMSNPHYRFLVDNPKAIALDKELFGNGVPRP